MWNFEYEIVKAGRWKREHGKYWIGKIETPHDLSRVSTTPRQRLGVVVESLGNYQVLPVNHQPARPRIGGFVVCPSPALGHTANSNFLYTETTCILRE